MQKKIKIAFVGQTPPPFGGQAIMIEKILKGNYKDVTLFHIRMAFSKEMDEIGKANAGKVFHLFAIIARIYYTRIFKRANVLYYPPAGPDKVPIIRDILILISTRWLFKKTIFHYHAGGVSQFKFSNPFLNTLYKLAYYRADAAILLSELNPPDGKELKAKKEFIVPYGIEDHYKKELVTTSSKAKILFVAIIKETKGILVLLEACKILKDKNLNFDVEVMGKFESKEFEARVKDLVSNYHLQDHIKFIGVLSGDEKFKAFGRATIFCFPTFFESETFGVVLLEAMQFGLPLVGTKWRGIPSIITNGENGFLVEPKNALSLSEALEKLIGNPELGKKMGTRGRHLYEINYSLTRFHEHMNQVFVTC